MFNFYGKIKWCIHHHFQIIKSFIPINFKQHFKSSALPESQSDFFVIFMNFTIFFIFLVSDKLNGAMDAQCQIPLKII